MNITILLKSSITIPLILSVLVFGILFMMYKMNKLDNQIYTPLNIGLITASVFIVSWFIVDTILTNKNNKEILYDNIHKNNKEQIESSEMNYSARKEPIKNLTKQNNKQSKQIAKQNITKQNITKQNIAKDTVTTEINNNQNIKNILEEPLNQIPEYKYMTTNNVQIPEDVDLYLDRGKI